MSRDGYFLLHIFKSLFPSYNCDYIYISRNAMINANDEYINYVRQKVDNSIVIDLLGSGKSFEKFTKKHNINFKKYILYFMGRDPNNIIEYFPDMKMYAIFNYFNRYIERLNYACHGSFLNFDDNKIITKKFEYDLNYYEPIYKLVHTACTHISKIKDILIDYKFDEKKLYEMMYYYFGPPDSYLIPECKSFSLLERKVLDNIGHEDLHDNKNNIRSNIDKDYFLDLEEFLHLNFE
jgi:hypothetical protein